jgi:hypothetical protein
MTNWSCHRDSISKTHTKYRLLVDGAPLSYGLALDLLESEQTFRDYLTKLLATSDYTAYRWETPPVTTSTLNRQFEFVLKDDPSLNVRPEPEVFASYFEKDETAPYVLAISNLGKTATLIIPRGIGEISTYAHLATFLRKAPSLQIHALWRCVAATVQQKLSHRPVWVSTAGGAVAWLHIRIEGSPKYYSYEPYTAG